MHAALLTVATPAVPLRYLVASIAAHGLLAAAPMGTPDFTAASAPQSLRVDLRRAAPPAPPAAELTAKRQAAPARPVRAKPLAVAPARLAAIAMPQPATVAPPQPSLPAVDESGVAPPEPPAPLQLARAAPAAVDLAPLRSGPSDFHLLSLYTQQLGAAVNQQRRYPPLARVRGWQGTTVLDLSIGPAGEVVSLSVASSSGFDLLDEQAIDMVREAQPLPAPSVESGSLPLLVQLPVTFSLR
ncbi:MAG TPA: TonB family protein [Rhodocyclaceae bacterium]